MNNKVTGRVLKLEEAEHISNDSVMELLRTNSDKSSLVIVPDVCGNICHLLSGINNSSEDSKRKKVCLELKI